MRSDINRTLNAAHRLRKIIQKVRAAHCIAMLSFHKTKALPCENYLKCFVTKQLFLKQSTRYIQGEVGFAIIVKNWLRTKFALVILVCK